MSSLLVDLVKIQVLSSGTGAFQLGAAATGFRGIEALTDGGNYSYSVQSGAQFELGTGVYNAGTGTLIRTPILSSNGNAAVAFGANVEVKFVALAADLTPPGALPIVQATGTGTDVAMSQKATTDNLDTKTQSAAIGIAGTDTNMGLSPGSVLSDNGTAKQWFGESEAAIEVAQGDATAAKAVTDKFATTGTAQTLPLRTARLNFPVSGGGAVIAFGTNGPNAGANYSGLQIGGGTAEWGNEGVTMGGDGHPSWLRKQPSRNYSPIEDVIYPTAAQGEAQSQSGTNQVNRISGSGFDAAWIGRKFYLGGTKYKIAAVADANTLTVTTIGGGAVSFGSTTTYLFHVFYVYGAGICDVNGTTVTHVSGDPFLAFAADAPHELKINGTVRAVASGAGAPYTLTLSASLGTLTGATYEYFTDIDDTMVQQRLQKFLGSTEENITQGVKPWCYFLRTQIAGSGLHYPVHLASGEDKAQITLMPDGMLRFGWHGSIKDPTANTRNYVEFDSGPSGVFAAFRGRGVDANVGIGFDAQGTGNFTFTSGSFGRINFRIYGSPGTDYLVTDASNGAPFLAAEGSSTDIDIPILAKGNGKVRFGTWTSNADAPINGYITVKDSAGNLRKLATIA